MYQRPGFGQHKHLDFLLKITPWACNASKDSSTNFSGLSSVKHWPISIISQSICWDFRSREERQAKKILPEFIAVPGNWETSSCQSHEQIFWDSYFRGSLIMWASHVVWHRSLLCHRSWKERFPSVCMSVGFCSGQYWILKGFQSLSLPFNKKP